MAEGGLVTEGRVRVKWAAPVKTGQKLRFCCGILQTGNFDLQAHEAFSDRWIAGLFLRAS
jgi:hypothetical protein